MSRGIGATQRRILDALGQSESVALTVAELGAALGASQRQIRTAVRSLEARGLVAVTNEFIGWQGTGSYGRLCRRRWKDEPPANLVAEPGDPWPIPAGYSRVTTKQTEFIYQGMPIHGLMVWLPDRLAQQKQRQADAFATLKAALTGG
jgi:DNA-binding transcriptional ArsR family regulator